MAIARRTGAAAARRRPRRRRFPVVRWSLFATFVGLTSFVAGLLVAPIDLTVAPPLHAALLLDADGRYITSIRAPELREEIAGDRIPQVLQDAVIAAEDERYFAHQGVDPLAILRAAYQDIVRGGRQGGSTITQQYVKNVYVGSERTWLRKVREAALALRAESRFGKREILVRYLNGLYLGNGTFGVQAACKFYFGVDVTRIGFDRAAGRESEELALARAAMLAGIAPAPSAWNPVRNFAAAKARQLYALNRMVANGMVTAQQASRAYQVELRPLVEYRPPQDPTPAPVFTDMVAQELKETVGEDELFRGGLRVRTTLDLVMQRAVDQAVKDLLPDADDPDAAVVVLDWRSGDLKAIHSSRYVPVAKKGGFNLATQGRRSPGSTMKPFALAAALGRGVRADQVFPAPSCLRLRGVRKPICNNEGSGGGRMTLHRALVASVNTVFVQLAQRIGTERVKDMAERSGLAGRIDTGATMVLGGGVEITPASLAQGYATIAAGGVRRDLRLVLHLKANGGSDRAFSGVDVRPPEPRRPRGVRVMKPAVAQQVRAILTEAVERGTGRAARQEFPVFGKTGTTDNYTNAWFVGCSPELCVATWMGYRQALKSMRNVNGVRRVLGGTLPAAIFDRFWERLAQFRHEEALSEAGAPTATPSATRRPFRRRTPPPSAPRPSRTAVPSPSRVVSPAATPTPTGPPRSSPPAPVPTLQPPRSPASDHPQSAHPPPDGPSP